MIRIQTNCLQNTLPIKQINSSNRSVSMTRNKSRGKRPKSRGGGPHTDLDQNKADVHYSMNQETSAALSVDRTALERGGGGTYSSSGTNQLQAAAQHDSDGTHPHSILCIPMVAAIWAKVLWGFGTAKQWISLLWLTMISMIGKVATLLIKLSAPVFRSLISISHLATALMLDMTSRVILSMARHALWSTKRLAAATVRLLVRLFLIILAEVMSFCGKTISEGNEMDVEITHKTGGPFDIDINQKSAQIWSSCTNMAGNEDSQISIEFVFLCRKATKNISETAIC